MLNLTIIVFKLAIAAALVWYAANKIDLTSALNTLASVSPAAITFAVLLFGVQFLLVTLRLLGLLKAFGAQLRFAATLEVILIGSFFSQAFISFVGGDAMRIWRLTRSHISVAVAAKSVLFDRVAGFGGLIILLLVATPFLVTMIQAPEMLIGLLLVLLSAPGAIAIAFLLRRLPRSFRRWRLVTLSRELISNALDMWRSRRGAGILLWLSIAIQFMNVLILYVLANGLGLQIRFFDGFLLFPAVLFLSMLPISFAGWGVREGAMVAALSLVGVPSHQSLALSVCFGLCALAVCLPGGAIWLLARQSAAVDLPVRS